MPDYFIDTSALVKLYHSEAGSERTASLAADPGSRLFISRLSLVEVQSAFSKSVRIGTIPESALRRLSGLFFADIARRRFTVAEVRKRHYDIAGHLMQVHGVTQNLRTLDAIQLAVAIALTRTSTTNAFIAADAPLCAVAKLEGLAVINPLRD